MYILTGHFNDHPFKLNGLNSTLCTLNHQALYYCTSYRTHCIMLLLERVDRQCQFFDQLRATLKLYMKILTSTPSSSLALYIGVLY